MKIDSNIVAVVTGGSSGLGQQTVRFLFSKGCNIVIADLNQPAALKIIRQLGTDRIIFHKTDVSNQQSVQKLFETAVEKFKKVNVVVNCAGVIHMGLTLSKNRLISTKDFQRVFRINVIGTFNVTKHAARCFSKQQPINQQRGVIINVASVAGFQGQKGQVIYAATKGAIISMTLPLARDLGHLGIRVMTIAPGIFDTPMKEQMSKKVQQSLLKSTALKRFGRPIQFAECVQSIIVNSYASGETWRLDGGLRLPHL